MKIILVNIIITMLILIGVFSIIWWIVYYFNNRTKKNNYTKYKFKDDYYKYYVNFDLDNVQAIRKIEKNGSQYWITIDQNNNRKYLHMYREYMWAHYSPFGVDGGVYIITTKNSDNVTFNENEHFVKKLLALRTSEEKILTTIYEKK